MWRVLPPRWGFVVSCANEHQGYAAFILRTSSTASGHTSSQTAYLKASNAEQDDWFGGSVAVAGNVVLVGAPREDSGAQGVNGPQDNNAVMLSGAAYLFDLDAQPDPWTNLGLGLAGASGVPLLIGTGVFTAGSAISLRVLHAAPTAPGFLVLGLSVINLPLLGGTLVPNPDLLLNLSTSVTGGVQTQVPVPASFPPGIALFAQAWILDAGGISGWAATNALTATSL